MRVLSIQSHVAYGHVGNGAAVFPLQRLGHEVVVVPTVVFAHHTGYGAPRGLALTAEDVTEVVLGLDELGVLAGVDVVLSGYLTAALVPVVADAVARVRSANPGASYTCDPVLGDQPQGVFVQPEVPDLVRDLLLPLADVVTPNRFELGRLTGLPTGTLAEVVAAVDALDRDTVLVTGVETVLVTRTGAWTVTTPTLDLTPAGSGDLTAALFSAHLRTSGDPVDALARTASSVHAVLRATHAAGSRELHLVEAQAAIASPACEFEVRAAR